MMLTVGLIALTATFVSINVGQSDAKIGLLEAKRFVALMNLAQDESIMTGRPINLTVEASENSYQFSPLDLTRHVSSLIGNEASQADQEGNLEGSEKVFKDKFLAPHSVPDVVQMSFNLKPVSSKSSAATRFVPKRVHEILNESILDKASRLFKDEAANNRILIEPNGLISPFSLTMRVDGSVSVIELDRFGRAGIKRDTSK